MFAVTLFENLERSCLRTRMFRHIIKKACHFASSYKWDDFPMSERSWQIPVASKFRGKDSEMPIHKASERMFVKNKTPTPG